MAVTFTNWEKTTIGTLSAFEARHPGYIIGSEVRLMVDHPGPSNGTMYRGELTAMRRSELSDVYYHIEITGGSAKVVHKLDLPLSHLIEYADHRPKYLQLPLKKLIPTEAERVVKYASLDRITEEPEFCIICKQEIKIQIFKGTAVCSTNCTKIYSGESIEQVDNHPKGSA